MGFLFEVRGQKLVELDLDLLGFLILCFFFIDNLCFKVEDVCSQVFSGIKVLWLRKFGYVRLNKVKKIFLFQRFLELLCTYGMYYEFLRRDVVFQLFDYRVF